VRTCGGFVEVGLMGFNSRKAVDRLLGGTGEAAEKT